MAKFAINNSITQERYGRPIRKGTVKAGPFKVDGVDHYHVKWDWFAKGYEPFGRERELDLVCDLTSQKYELT